MNVKAFLALTKAGITEQMSFRLGIFTVFAGNLIYLTIIYFLWKSIFDSAPTETVSGMTFANTMIYLVLAMALFNFMEVYLVWNMGRNIQSGKIVLDLLKPIPLIQYMFFESAGFLAVNFVLTLLPTMGIVYFISGRAFALSINLVFFFIAAILGLAINYFINFFVATICIFTESIWGINIMKEVIILLFSGASIPLAFFPDSLLKVVQKLPFQAIYNTPLTLLIGKDISTTQALQMIGVQVFWVAVTALLAIVFFRFALRRITVNGG